jgi:hypothetical protein
MSTIPSNISQDPLQVIAINDLVKLVEQDPNYPIQPHDFLNPLLLLASTISEEMKAEQLANGHDVHILSTSVTVSETMKRALSMVAGAKKADAVYIAARYFIAMRENGMAADPLSISSDMKMQIPSQLWAGAEKSQLEIFKILFDGANPPNLIIHASGGSGHTGPDKIDRTIYFRPPSTEKWLEVAKAIGITDASMLDVLQQRLTAIDPTATRPTKLQHDKPSKPDLAGGQV